MFSRALLAAAWPSVAVAEALSRDPPGRDGFVLRRQATPRRQQALATDENKAAIRDLVDVIEQPFDTRPRPGVRFDGALLHGPALG
jgi:hypothetical protein